MPASPFASHCSAARSRPRCRFPFATCTLAGLVACCWRPASGQVPAVLNGGPPVQVIPYVSEPGVPAFTVTPGTANPFFGADGLSGGTTSDGGGTGTSSSGDGSGSKSMASMMAQPWGDAASQNAQTIGITPVALAATCQIEASGCQTNPASSSQTITGTFQMLDSTYTAMIKAALADNPSQASSIVPGLAGKLDPVTEGIASAEYLKQGAVALQGNGLSDPSVLDVRGFYNFGPGNAVAIAQASDSSLMSAQVSGLTAAQFKANGIDPSTTTVGQWRASVTAVIGASAASSSVLLAKS